MRSRGRLAVCASALALALAVFGGRAAAAVPPPLGGLTQLPGAAGCLANAPLPPCANVNAFFYPSDIATTPDGKQVLVIDPGDDALVVFNRAADGALAYSYCVSKDGSGERGDHTCAVAPVLIDISKMVISPDGKQVYVTTATVGGGAVITLNRDAATGTITPTRCVAQNSNVLCSATKGLTGAESIAMNGNGSLLAVGGSNAVTLFSRNLSTGALTSRGCVSASDSGCAEGNAGYADVQSVDFAPNARAVYAAARLGTALEVMSYDPTTHVVAPLQCIAEAGFVPAGCTASSAVFDPSSVTASQSNPFVYTGDDGAAEIATWHRAADDRLSFVSCRSLTGDVGSAAGICSIDYRLQDVTQVKLSADGTNLYAIASRSNPDQGSQDIATYTADAAGAPLPLPDPYSCWETADEGSLGACKHANGLGDPQAMTLAPLGDYVYVAVDTISSPINTSSTIAIFAREVPPTCAAVSARTAARKAVSVSLGCADLNNDPLTRAVLAKPAHGTLGAVSSGGRVTYTPKPGFVGTDHFTFAASDGRLSSAPTSATITVAPVKPVRVTIPKQTSVVKRSSAPVRIKCSGPHGRRCVGRLTLSIGRHGAKIGSVKFSIRAGTQKTLKVPLRRSAVALLTNNQLVPARALARYADSGAHYIGARGTVTLTR